MAKSRGSPRDFMGASNRAPMKRHSFTLSAMHPSGPPDA